MDNSELPIATRRNFFKYLGLAGGVAAGGAAAVAATLPKDKPEHLDQMDEGSNLTIQHTYGEKLRLSSDGPLGLGTTTTSNRLYFDHQPQYVPGTQKQVSVGMKPGPDGELYLKVNGKWRKVVTE